MTDLFTYPQAAGHRGGETSRAAAASMQERLGPIQEQVLYALRRSGGLATFELPEYVHGVSFAALQPRTSELAAMGKIIATDERRVNPETGKSAKVWRLRGAF